MSFTLLTGLVAATLFATASAETHTIRFNNQCGYGTPQLVYNGAAVSTGQDYTVDGSFSGIAYLQTGDCGLNGEECLLLEMTLINPTVPGGGSSADISLIAPHAFNVQGSFSYFNGCNNTGANCADASCAAAFYQPDETEVQVACETDDVDLLIAFCADATQ
ncbi:glycopeptide, partial [Wolfiporia cocos MD-104 SS10]